MSITVNDLIGLNYANLRNPIVPQSGINLTQPLSRSYNQSPDIDPSIYRIPSTIDQNSLAPMGVTNQQPMLANTTGIAPLLQQEMPLDYEEMIREDKSIVPQKNKGLNSLLQLALSAAIPGAGLILGGARKLSGLTRGLAGLNRRLQQSDFGQSSSLVDYLNRKRRQSDEAIRNMVQARGIQKKIDSGMYDDKDPSGIGDRGRGQITSSSPPPKKTSSNYKTASYDRRTTKY